MKIRENLTGLSSLNNKNVFSLPDNIQIGRVYGVVTTLNTPTEKQFEKVGGFSATGTIFYKDYDKTIDVITEYNNDFFDSCKIAKPISQNIPYPLVDELVHLTDLPSSNTQINNISIQKYYTDIINIYNNSQHNSQPAGDSYSFKTFIEDSSVKNIIRFEGDYIIQGRKGNSIRFGSTVKNFSNINEWSSGPGVDGDPLIILSNGQGSKNSAIHTEYINKDSSAIYLTSTQTIPLSPSKNDTLNPITLPINVGKYYNPQIILNGDRLVLNSKKDDVLIFATTNIELNTKNIINLNADDRVHLNTPNISLGTKSDGTIADEPLVLGNKLIDFASRILSGLSEFCSSLQSAKSTPEGSDLIQIQAAAQTLNNILIEESDNINLMSLLSKQNYTI